MRRITLMLAAIAVVAAILPAGAAPGLPGQAAGALASDNVEFVANIPVDGAIGARILGETMYVTGATGLQIFDVSLGVPVPVAALPLPHFENEDVDTNGDVLLISADSAFSFPEVRMYVIDVAPKAAGVIAPVLLSTLQVPEGHTVSCINECSYAGLAGSSTVFVVDLRDPSNAKVVGSFRPSIGGTHDVQVDEAGVAWIVGGGGIAGYTTEDPLNPTLVVRQNGSFHNDFILHNSWRPNATAMDPEKLSDGIVDPGELVLVTEEDWLSLQNGFCGSEGQFQTGHFRERSDGSLTVEKLDAISLGNLTDGTGKPVGGTCSSHYFDHRSDGIVAVAWYEQGTRFIDVSDPYDIRQVGYFMPAVTATWNVKFHGEYIYTIDVARGIDVLRFTGETGDPEVLAPTFNEPPVVLTRPSEDWGYLCKIPVAA